MSSSNASTRLGSVGGTGTVSPNETAPAAGGQVRRKRTTTKPRSPSSVMSPAHESRQALSSKRWTMNGGVSSHRSSISERDRTTTIGCCRSRERDRRTVREGLMATGRPSSATARSRSALVVQTREEGDASFALAAASRRAILSRLRSTSSCSGNPSRAVKRLRCPEMSASDRSPPARTTSHPCSSARAASCTTNRSGESSGSTVPSRAAQALDQ
jgi:hypothetical protein